jgi:uncharacterized membrane protein
MVLMAAEVIGILMRWAHIVSAVMLIGGITYARVVAFPALAGAGEEDGGVPPFERLTLRYRPMVYAAIAGLVVSGVYNFLSHRGHTPYFHLWFGIKIVLALHVFAGAILAVKSADATPEYKSKRARRMTGVVVSGLLVILVSAYLRLIY